MLLSRGCGRKEGVKMTRATRYVLAVALAVALPAILHAQAGAPLTPPTTQWTGSRTPDGQPDIGGSYAKDWIGARGPNFDLEEGQDPDEMRATGRNRENFPKPQIVRTPDGRIPYQPWARELRIANRKNFFNATELWHLDSNARCLPMGFPRESLDQGPEIIQTPGFVFFQYPYNSVVRTVYLDGRPALSDRVKLWYGDSHGRWDGNTLIVEGRNFNDHAWYDTYGNFHSPDLRTEERFTFVGNKMYYDVTSHDPRVFTQPWTAHVEFTKRTGQVDEPWETACFEGERSVQNMVAPKASGK
jgi:hypothetical protein